MRQNGAMRTRVIVGITGGSGSGKTTFAKRLASRLEPNAVLLHHDDYYWHLPHMTVREAASYDFDDPTALETDLLVEHLRALKNGKVANVPSYDFAKHARTDAARNVEPAPIALVDGMLVMCDPALLALFDLTVFIDADPNERLRRRLARDCSERGASPELVMDMYLKTCQPAHERYVEPFREKAGIVIEDALDEVGLEAVAMRIERLLNGKTAGIAD